MKCPIDTKTILIFSANRELVDFLHLNLFHHYSVHIIIRENLEEAIQCLNLFNNVELLLLDLDKGTYHEIVKKQSGLLKDIKIGIINNDDMDNVLTFQWKRNVPLKKIVSDISEKLALELRAQVDPEEFVSIRMVYLKYFDHVPSGIYVMIGGQTGAKKFIKRFAENDPITFDDYKHLQSHMENVWIKKKDEARFLEIIGQTINFYFLKNKIEVVKEFEVKFGLFEHYSKMMGVDHFVLSLAKECSDLVLKWISSQPSFKSATKELRRSEVSLRIKNIQLTMLISTFLVKFMNLKFPEEQIQKIMLATILSNSLIDDVSIEIRSEYVLAMPVFKAQYQVIKRHAALTAEWYARYESIPIQVLQMIKEHHGSNTGTGFHSPPQRFLTSNSHILIASEEMASLILKSNFDNQNMLSIMNEVISKVAMIDNKKIIKSLKEFSMIVAMEEK